MKIHSLTVQNFRCFKNETFEFSPQFNLFVGINGSGKTSLLKAVAASLAAPINGLRARGIAWPHLEEENARLVLVEQKGRVRYEHSYPIKLDFKGKLFGSEQQWFVEAHRSGDNGNTLDTKGYGLLKKRTENLEQGNFKELPLVAFYTAERRWLLSDTTAKQAVTEKESRLDAYESWNNAALDTKGLESWIIAKSIEKLEEQEFSISGDYELHDKPLDELDIVNTTVQKAIPNSKGLRYYSKYRRLVLEWKSSETEPTPFETLSDGQRGMVALIADIARRMCLLNPQLGDLVLKETPGIVIIDELDIHLHPAWQRRLPNLLKELFPKIQFITASHSPQIIGELAADEIWLMDDAKVLGHPERSLGLTSGEVLEELMGGKARNQEVAKQLKEIDALLDDDKITEAKEQLSRLRTKVGEIPAVLGLEAEAQSLEWLEEQLPS